jgi:3',5'-cyclic AMP phosphodiesterase CpdA
LLEQTGKQGLSRIVMIHHPPVRGAVSQHKRLFGIGRFQRLVRRHGAELVLHGHSHEPTLYWIGNIPVVGVAAAGQAPGGRHPAAQYNLIGIEREKDGWLITLTRRGLTGPAMPVCDVQTVRIGAKADSTLIRG